MVELKDSSSTLENERIVMLIQAQDYVLCENF